MMCHNKVIFSILIFSVKVLIYFSRENVACFYGCNVLWTSFIMEVNIMHPDQTASQAGITFSVLGTILCYQEHILVRQCTLFTS